MKEIAIVIDTSEVIATGVDHLGPNVRLLVVELVHQALIALVVPNEEIASLRTKMKTQE